MVAKVLLSLICGTAVLQVTVPHANAQGRLMVASRPANLVAETRDGWIGVSALRPGDFVTVIDRQTFKTAGKPDRQIVRVRNVAAVPAQWLWVSSHALGEIVDAEPVPNAHIGTLPPHIQYQSEAIQQAWRQVQIAMAENEKLDPQLPDPYFARAEISMLVHDFDSAFRDYLRAIHLAKAGGQDLIQHSAYFERLQEVLEQYDAMPRPPANGSARAHYVEGVHAFWRGNDKDAIDHLTNAIAVDPTESLFWYFRALAYKRSGDEARAKHDALLGAHAEWQDGIAGDFGQALQRVQGNSRKWLESYRLGDPRRLRLIGQN